MVLYRLIPFGGLDPLALLIGRIWVLVSCDTVWGLRDRGLRVNVVPTGQTTILPVLQIMSANHAKDPFSVDALAAELIAEYNKLEKAKDHFERLKGDFLKKLTADNIGAVKVKEGTVTVCTRTSKDYGQTVKILEANLKAEKARLDHLGEFVIKNVTHYLRIN